MDEITQFGEVVLLGAAGLMLAILATKLTRRVPIPTPAIFLVAAAVISDLFPNLHEFLSIRDVSRIGVLALVVILFHGGMGIGWRRLGPAAVPITAVGVVGTFATAAIITLVAHGLFGFDWVAAGILGAALAPTDPAVMFSVLGNREVGGRSGTILEGESGVNDPVGIALMIGVLELATHEEASLTVLVEEFALEMAVGAAMGLATGSALVSLKRRIALPSETLYPLLTLAAAGVIYGATSVLHGSGFLAVFLAGLFFADPSIPYRDETHGFQAALASLAEIVVFVALGLTVDVTELAQQRVWLDGLLLAVILAFAARPLAVLPLVAFADLRWGERLFISWTGLKGAVPILLAAFALLAQASGAERIYGIVFVVVLFSVVVQGTLVPTVAERLGITMRLRTQ